MLNNTHTHTPKHTQKQKKKKHNVRQQTFVLFLLLNLL